MRLEYKYESVGLFSEITRRMEVGQNPKRIEEIAALSMSFSSAVSPWFSEYGVEETIRLRLYTRAQQH